MPWAPTDLISASAAAKIRSHAKSEDIIPEITARALRLSLYRGLAASGGVELDSLFTSVEWARAMLIFSAMDLVQPLGVSRNMDLFAGYPRIVEYAANVFQRNTGEQVYRIYARTAETANDIVTNKKILASHRGYVTSDNKGLKHFQDITGVFITRPGVAPKRVGIIGYEHYVDFKIQGAVPVLKMKGEDAHLIPGPPRISREELANASRVMAGERSADNETSDVVELLQLFNNNIPEFSIPIGVEGRGKLTGIAEGGKISGGLASANSLVASGLMAAAVRSPLSGFSMVVPTMSFR